MIEAEFLKTVRCGGRVCEVEEGLTHRDWPGDNWPTAFVSSMKYCQFLVGMHTFSTSFKKVVEGGCSEIMIRLQRIFFTIDLHDRPSFDLPFHGLLSIAKYASS